METIEGVRKDELGEGGTKCEALVRLSSGIMATELLQGICYLHFFGLRNSHATGKVADGTGNSPRISFDLYLG